MPFPMRVQPIDVIRQDGAKPPVFKSRLKRLFDRPFNSVVRNSSTEKQSTGGEKDMAPAAPDFEPSSVCLDKMVRSFMEDNNDKQSTAAVKCGRHRCNCFNGSSNDSSDDELDFLSDSVAANSSLSDPSDTLKSLIPCASVAERNLLADSSKIVEKNKTCKRKDVLRKIVTDGLIALGYNASLCKSKWESSSSVPAGEYEYTDVIMEGERIIIDVDFRSEFEIARSTSSYKSILQSLPSIFVGKPDRLQQILSISSEAARQSLKKKGMHIAPWRKAEYMKSKWLGPHTRITQVKSTALPENEAVKEPADVHPETEPDIVEVTESECGELDLIFGEGTSSSFSSESDLKKLNSPVKFSGVITPSMTWQLPELRPKSLGNKAVATGLASLLEGQL